MQKILLRTHSIKLNRKAKFDLLHQISCTTRYLTKYTQQKSSDLLMRMRIPYRNNWILQGNYHSKF